MQTPIRPGQPWLDEGGRRIEAHGGSMLYENGRYYWYGEDKSHTSKKGKIWTWGVRCYSSADLVSWKDEGHMVEPAPEDKSSIFHPNRRLDRPHLLKNPRTGKYVLWLKYSDKAHFAILTADNLLGPYTLVDPFLRPYGRKAGDFDLALDEITGDGYLYVELDHQEVVTCRLDDTFTGVAGEPSVIYTGLHPPLSREGITHFTHGGKHYLLTSGMTGYVPNPSEIAVADDWMDPFHVLGDPCVDDDSCATFNSQPSCVFAVQGTGQLVMMADRWVPDYVVTRERHDMLYRAIASRYDKSIKSTFKEKLELIRSPMMGGSDTSKANYVCLPIEWDGDMPRLRWHDRWTVKECRT